MTLRITKAYFANLYASKIKMPPKVVLPVSDISEVTTDEMKFMHENMKHRKEPGGDGLVTDILKYVDEESIKYYQNYLPSACRKVHHNFSRGIAALLYKKRR